MKKTFFTIISILFALAVNAQEWVGIGKSSSKKIQETLISSSEKKVVVDVKIGGFYKENVKTPQGDKLVISGEGMAYMPIKGAPNLPMYPISMIVGDMAEMEVSVVESEYVDFENVEIAPSKGNFSRQINPDDVPYTYGEMYQQDAFYPAQQAVLGNPYVIRDFRGQNVMVYPYAYNPVTKTLRVYTYLRIESKKISDDGINPKVNRKRNNVVDSEINASYKRRFINYPTKERYTFVEDEGEMLIVCVDSYLEAIRPLVEWKNISGRPTTMVALSETGDNLKQYIQNYYNSNPNLVYLLLVGEYNNLPPHPMDGGYSDNYFGMLEGDDEYEEVLVGRLSVKDIEDAKNQVSKIIYYERDIDGTATWLTKASGVAAKEGKGHYNEIDYEHMDFIRDTLLHYTYTEVSQFYADVNNPTVSKMVAEYNKGLGLINYCNHGLPESWSVADFSTKHVHLLTNDNKWPIIWSVACNNGQFQYDECFAEAWMRAVNSSTGVPTGAIGGMFSWISQPWLPPMYGQDEMNAILTEWRAGYKHTLGGASCNGNMFMMDMDVVDGPRTHNTWLLFGDPSLMVRTDVPKSMNVNLPQQDLFIGMTSLKVDAQADYGIATLSLNGKAIASAPVVNGVAELMFDPLVEEETATLVVIGYNRITEIKEINIIPADNPYVICAGYELDDDNNRLDYGETANVLVSFKNIGMQSTDGVTVKLSSDSKYVTIIKGDAYIPSIQSGETIKLDDEFTVKINPNIPNETMINFVLTCSNGKDTWMSKFNVYAYAPVFAINSITIPSGKDIKPGDTGTLEMKFDNVGGAAAYNVLAEVFSSSSDIEFKNTVLVDEVLEGETFTASVEYTVSPSVLSGSVFEVICSANADYVTCKASRELKVGWSGEDFESGDFLANNWKMEGAGKWIIDDKNAYEGKYCAKTAALSNNKYAKLKLQLEVLDDGPLTFYVKTSTEADYDKLEFYTNPLVKPDAEWSGENNWTQYVHNMTKGSYSLEWKYIKDTSSSEGEDCVYIDDICFPPVSVVTMLEAVSGLKGNIQDEEITLTWNEVANADGYVVRRDGEIVSTQTSTSFSESKVNGIVTYTVVAKNGGNYSAPAFLVVDSNNKVVENVIKVEDNKVALYPNPTSGIVYVKLDKSFDAVVYNYQGQVVMRKTNNDGQIDLSSLNTGIYFLEIRENNNVMIEKIILTK